MCNGAIVCMNNLQPRQWLAMQHCYACQLGLQPMFASGLLQLMLTTNIAADATVVLLLTHALRHNNVHPSTLLHSIICVCLSAQAMKKRGKVTSTVATSTLLHLINVFPSFCTGYEEEEEDYGYLSHMRQASLELNVTEVASPRGSSGKRSCPTPKFGLHTDMPDFIGMCKIDCSGETRLVLLVSSSSCAGKRN